MKAFWFILVSIILLAIAGVIQEATRHTKTNNDQAELNAMNAAVISATVSAN